MVRRPVLIAHKHHANTTRIPTVAVSAYARGEEEGGNQLEACHIMWDGLPLEGHSEGILGTFVQSNSEFRQSAASARREFWWRSVVG